MCQLCEIEDEDDWHVFFGCTTIIQCWREIGLSFIIDSRVHAFTDAKSLILDICNREDKRDAGRFALMIDVLWKNGIMLFGIMSRLGFENWLASLIQLARLVFIT